MAELIEATKPLIRFEYQRMFPNIVRKCSITRITTTANNRIKNRKFSHMQFLKQRLLNYEKLPPVHLYIHTVTKTKKECAHSSFAKLTKDHKIRECSLNHLKSMFALYRLFKMVWSEWPWSKTACNLSLKRAKERNNKMRYQLGLLFITSCFRPEPEFFAVHS